MAELSAKMQSKRLKLQIPPWTNLWTGPGQSRLSPPAPEADAVGLRKGLKPQMAKHFRSGDVSSRGFEARFMKSFSV